MHKLYNDKIDTSDRDLEDGSQLLDETNYTIRDATNSPIEKTPWDGLFTSESLSLLREKWFTRNEFPAGTSVLDIKYKHLGLKHQNSFYLFNDWLNYVLAHYFAKSEMTKGNVNKLLSNLLMTPFTKNLSYKNADEWMKKLSEIP